MEQLVINLRNDEIVRIGYYVDRKFIKWIKKKDLCLYENQCDIVEKNI